VKDDDLFWTLRAPALAAPPQTTFVTAS